VDSVAVIGFGSRMVALAEAAVAVLGRVQQSLTFAIPPVSVVELPVRADNWSAEELFQLLGSPPSKSLVIGLVDQALECGWFSRKTQDGRAVFITTWGWEWISELPLLAYVVYQLGAVTLRARADLYEFHDKTRGCVQDLCAARTEFNWKLRTGDICDECDTLLRLRAPEGRGAFIAIFDEARRIALDRTPAPSNFFYESILDRVDRTFPFPVAYCVRSMRVEHAYSRKLQHLVKSPTLCTLTASENAPARMSI
jgi:hypothetical protein